jgi:hypothetical protein
MLALATAIVGFFGVIGALVIGEHAPVELLLQVQPWRTLWLASVVAYLLVPVAVLNGWRADPYARASSILLVTAVCALNQGAALTSSAAALLLAGLPNRMAIPHGRLAVAGALAAAVITIAFSLMSAAAVAKIPAWGQDTGAAFEQLRNVFGLVLPGVAIVVALLLLLRNRVTWPRIGLSAAILATLGLASGVPAWREFRSKPYTGEQHALFANWRSQIPRGVNVFWPGSPVFVWFLLERPSYVSVSQLAGVIFSREVSLEGLDRIRSLGGLADEGAVLRRPGATDPEFRPLTRELLFHACRDERLGFVVSPVDLSLGAAFVAWPDETRRIYLYDCRTYRAPARSGSPAVRLPRSAARAVRSGPAPSPSGLLL